MYAPTSSRTRPSTVQVIGVPLDLGANMRGANMGPASIRIADLDYKIGVLGYEVVDAGDLDVPIRDSLPDEAARHKYLHQIARICDDLQNHVHAALTAKRMPIILGGDHSIAIGTITGASRYFRELGPANGGGNIGLVWI